MIEIPAALQARLEAGATTLARAFVLTRRDGAVFGFTDHDRALNVAGVACAPEAGFAGGETRGESGFSPTRGALFGALDHAVFEEADLDNGVWDRARVEIYVVDWSEPELFYRRFTGELGAAKRSEAGFEIEVEGLSARLDRTIGRVFARRCDAELGDARCGVDLENHTYEASAVSVPAPGAVVLSGAGTAPLTHGVLIWTSGANAGARSRITAHRPDAGGTLVELDPAPPGEVSPGDAAQVIAGCDKRFETCRSRFSNGANFRGCPHMPGNDALLRPASAEAVRDGGAR